MNTKTASLLSFLSMSYSLLSFSLHIFSFFFVPCSRALQITSQNMSAVKICQEKKKEKIKKTSRCALLYDYLSLAYSSAIYSLRSTFIDLYVKTLFILFRSISKNSSHSFLACSLCIATNTVTQSLHKSHCLPYPNLHFS